MMQKHVHKSPRLHVNHVVGHLKDYAYQLEALTQGEWQQLSEGVRDDAHDLVDHWVDTSEELKTWWFIDKSLISAQLLKMLVSTADQTRTELWLLRHEQQLGALH